MGERNIPQELRRGTGDTVFAELVAAVEGADVAEDLAQNTVLAAASAQPVLFPAYILLHEAAAPAVALKTTADELARSAAARGEKAVEAAAELGETRSVRTGRGYWLVHSDPQPKRDDLGFCAIYHDHYGLPVTMFAGPPTNSAAVMQTLRTLTFDVLEPRSVNPLRWPIAALNQEDGEVHGTWQAWKVFVLIAALAAYDLLGSPSLGLLAAVHDWLMRAMPNWGVIATYVGAGLVGIWFGSLFIGAMQKLSTRRGLARDLAITRKLPPEAETFSYGRDASSRVLGGSLRDKLGEWLVSLAGVTGALVDRVRRMVPTSPE